MLGIVVAGAMLIWRWVCSKERQSVMVRKVRN